MKEIEQKGNLPSGDAIYLDHSGHFVPDAAAASKTLSQLGFTVTPFSAQVQPDPESGEMKLTGTGNICVMLEHGYLEFLVHTADTPLGKEFQVALDQRAGLHLVAFGVADAAKRHEQLSAMGHQMRPLVRMSRRIETADGTAEARFTVARLQSGVMPEGRVQLLTHMSEAAMWQPRWVDHPNGTQRLLSIIISAPDPAAAAARFGRLLGREPTACADQSFTLRLDRGCVEVIPETLAATLIGQSVAAGQAAFVACRLGVADLDRTCATIQAAGLPFRMGPDSVVMPFPKTLGLGAWIFEATP